MTVGVVSLWMATSVAFAEEWARTSETKTAGNVQVELVTQDPITVDLKAVKEVPGRFAGKVVFSNAGDWKAGVVVDPRALRPPVVFNIAVSSAGPDWTVIGSVLLDLAAVVIAVVVAMRRSPTYSAW